MLHSSAKVDLHNIFPPDKNRLFFNIYLFCILLSVFQEQGFSKILQHKSTCHKFSPQPNKFFLIFFKRKKMIMVSCPRQYEMTIFPSKVTFFTDGLLLSPSNFFFRENIFENMKLENYNFQQLNLDNRSKR